MPNPAVANAAYMEAEATFAKGDVVHHGMAWLATPMVAILAYSAGTTVMKFWNLRAAMVSATLRVGESVLIGGNPYQITAFTAGGSAASTVTIAGPGLIADMDWTRASRLLESSVKAPVFALISATGTTLKLKIPPLWAYCVFKGCRFTYSGATVISDTGFSSEFFLSDGNSVPGMVTITTTATVHAGIVDEAVAISDPLPAGAGNSQYRRGRTSAYYTEQDTTSGGVTRRTRSASGAAALEVRPFLIPFPYTVDGLGYAYTETDLVGCWIGGELYGIPTVLPSGYLPLRALGDPAHMANPFTTTAIAGGFSYDGGKSIWGRPKIDTTKPQNILMPSGYLECDWFPREAALTVQTRGGASTPLTGEKSVGWRNCQLTVPAIDPALASHYVIGYVDYFTHLNEVVVLTGALVPSSTMDLGALLPPLGQVKTFFFQASFLNGVGVRVRATSGTFYTAKLTPRVDVPMPWDSFGCDLYRSGSANLYARGGYHPSGVNATPRTPRVSSSNLNRIGDLHLLTPGGSKSTDADGVNYSQTLTLRLRASVAGTYTLSKTGSAAPSSAFVEFFDWIGNSEVLSATGTSISIALSPKQDRYVRVTVTNVADVVSLA